MKMGVKSILIIAIFGLLLFPVSSYAEECDMNSLRKLAGQVDVTTEFDYDGVDMGRYGDSIVTVTGLTEDIYAVTDNQEYSFFYQDMEDNLIRRRLNASSIKKIDVYSYSCPNKKIKTFDLNLKYYNTFYNDTACENLKNKTDFCSELTDVLYDRILFDKKIEEYNASNSTPKVESDNKTNWFLLLIIGGVLITAVIGIIFAIKYNRDNRLD